MDKEQIKKQSKALMDQFISSLESVKETGENSESTERKQDRRTPEECELTEGFPEKMLENAPSKKGNLIAAEKKKW